MFFSCKIIFPLFFYFAVWPYLKNTEKWCYVDQFFIFYVENSIKLFSLQCRLYCMMLKVLNPSLGVTVQYESLNKCVSVLHFGCDSSAQLILYLHFLLCSQVISVKIWRTHWRVRPPCGCSGEPSVPSCREKSFMLQTQLLRRESFQR